MLLTHKSVIQLAEVLPVKGVACEYTCGTKLVPFQTIVSPVFIPVKLTPCKLAIFYKEFPEPSSNS